MSVRSQYEKGIIKYYTEFGHEYNNPHHKLISTSFNTVLTKISNPNTVSYLDFACGDGLITELIHIWHQNHNITDYTIDATDPYMYNEYTKKHNRIAYSYGFEDVIKNNIFGNKLADYYNIVIISFAIHLIDDKYVNYFLDIVLQHTDYLLIISPTKNKGDFPHLNKVLDEKFSGTYDNKTIKVYYRLYKSNIK